jgi:hypothetical protein
VSFAWAQSEGIERLQAYPEAGCEQFMLQFMDYDRLEPIGLGGGTSEALSRLRQV